MSSNNDNIEAKQEIGVLIKSLQNAADFNEEEIIEEACGIGTLPYKEQIETTVSFTCSDVAYQIREGDNCDNKYAHKITSKIIIRDIDFVDDLTTTFYFQDPSIRNKGKSEITEEPSNQLINGKLDKATIQIYSNYETETEGGYKKSSYELLYHEINKLYNNYCRLSGIQLNKKYLYDIEDFKSGAIIQKNVTESEISNYCFDDKTANKMFKVNYLMKCCNILFSNITMERIKEETYNEIYETTTKENTDQYEEEGIYSKKEIHIKIVNNNIKKLKVYNNIYLYFKDNYDELFSTLTQNEADKIIEFISLHCIKVGQNNNSKALLRKILRNRINNLFYNICRMTSLAIAERIDENSRMCFILEDDFEKDIKRFNELYKKYHTEDKKQNYRSKKDEEFMKYFNSFLTPK